MRVSRGFLPDEWWAVLERIKGAVARAPVPNVGPHCHGCWQRTHCPAWLLPAHEGPSALTPFTAPTGLTPENAAQALQTVQAMKDALEIAEARLKDFARRHGGIVDGDRIWAPTTRTRKSADVGALERDGLDKYVRTSPSYEVFRWRRIPST